MFVAASVILFLAFLYKDVNSEVQWCLTPSCSPDCGVESIDYSIRNGPRGELPWHVGIYSKARTPYTLVCSGTIITTVLIISAAQCFWDEKRKLVPATRFAIAAGKSYSGWDDSRDEDPQKRDVTEIKIPPNFLGMKNDYKYDIAIIFFTPPLVYNTRVRPVCIDYDQDLERKQLHNGNGRTANWGEFNENGTSVLNVVNLKYTDGTQCLFNVPRNFIKYLSTDKFCAQNLQDNKICKNDRGGGLVFEEGDRELSLTRRYYLRGIGSTQPQSAKYCDSHPITTFAWISSYEDFIKEQFKEIGKQSFQCQDGNIILAKFRCDGAVHCADGSDETEESCAGLTCAEGLFRCSYGACVAAEICNGVKECLDGSDEAEALCDGDESTLSGNQPTVCRLPPYPRHGRYEVSNNPDAKPGDVLDNYYIEYKCDEGYEIVGNNTVYCFNGFRPREKTTCSKMCRLNRHPSVEYFCQVPHSSGGIRQCERYEPHGTVVTPNCKAPNYYSPQFLRNMKCTKGEWDYTATCIAVCGVTTPKGEILVTGGRASEKGEVPWHIGIYDKRESPYKQICGGSIISPTLVVSAAHCFWNDNRQMLQPASQYAAAAGKLYRDWDDSRDEKVQKTDIEDIKIPERFRGVQTNYQDDIALAVLANSLAYDVHIRPVCIDFGIVFDRKQLAVGNLGKVAGWGLIDEQGTKAQMLQVVDLPYIDIKQCLNDAPSYFRQYITGDKICAGYTNGTALCKGDSGGGLSFPEIFADEKRFFLRGVVSTAPNNEKSCNAFAVTTFTQIWRHEFFIKQNFYGT